MKCCQNAMSGPCAPSGCGAFSVAPCARAEIPGLTYVRHSQTLHHRNWRLLGYAAQRIGEASHLSSSKRPLTAWLAGLPCLRAVAFGGSSAAHAMAPRKRPADAPTGDVDAARPPKRRFSAATFARLAAANAY